MVKSMVPRFRDLSVIDVAYGLAEHLPSGMYSNAGIGAYVREALATKGIVDSFDALQRELYLTGTDLDSGVSYGRRDRCSGMDPADPAPMGGRIGLTFDDGPHTTVTPQILATLRAHNAPATFFMLGVQIADPANWSLVEEIRDDPLFTIGNHSWDPRRRLHALPPRHQQRQAQHPLRRQVGR